MKNKAWKALAAAAALVAGMAVNAGAQYESNLFYRFEDYTGGKIEQIITHSAQAPWNATVEFGGRVTSLEKAETDQGTSMWFKSDAENEAYLFGELAAKPVLENTIFEFDIKPLGNGQKPLITSIWGTKDSANTQMQNMWTVYPNGKIGIYARGYNTCYTRGDTATPLDADGNEITLPVGQWSKLAVVFDQEKMKLSYYINGVCIRSGCDLYNWGKKEDNLWQVNGNPVGFTWYRLQMAKDTEYANMTEEQKNTFGVYIDNMRIYQGTVPELIPESARYGTACDFEDYTGGELSYVDYDAVAPFKDSVIIRGQCKNSRAVETEKGTSLWLLVDDSGSGDQYMEGELLQKTVADKVVMQFDVKPLGLGSPTKFGMKGLKADGNQFFQQMFTVNPDGTLRIYARGKIAGAGAEESCYTENDSVTLRRGSGTAYTSAEAVTIPVGEWARLAVVYDVAGKKMDYYVNGKLIFGKAVPFDYGNVLAANGVNRIRMQTARYKEYSQHTEEEQQQVGLYIDNLKVFLGSAPAELTKGYYEARVLDENQTQVKAGALANDGVYTLEIIARGEDTANLEKDGAAVLAAYTSENGMTGANYITGRITKDWDTSLKVSLAGKAGERLGGFLWDGLATLNPLLGPIME